MSTEQAGTVKKRVTYSSRPELQKKVGKFLSDQFHASGLSRKDAAERGNVSEGYLTGLLAGRVVAPGPQILRAMADGWGFNVLYFYVLIGLCSDQDIRDLAAKLKTAYPSCTEEESKAWKLAESVCARLATLPPGQRERVTKMVSDVLNTLVAVSPRED